MDKLQNRWKTLVSSDALDTVLYYLAFYVLPVVLFLFTLHFTQSLWYTIFLSLVVIICHKVGDWFKYGR